MDQTKFCRCLAHLSLRPKLSVYPSCEPQVSLGPDNWQILYRFMLHMSGLVPELIFDMPSLGELT